MTEQAKNSRAVKLTAAAALAFTLAIPAEGLRFRAYNDTGGILTTCRGHTGADVKQGVTYSLAQCDAWLTADMRTAIEQVDKCAPGLPPEVLAAFGDAVFNMGPTIACNRNASTAARYLATGNIKLACEQLPRWSKSRVMGVMVTLPGLVKRRAAEKDLCLKGVSHA